MAAEPRDDTDEPYQRQTLGDLPLPTQFTTTLPTANPRQLPLADLEPEVFERLAAEFVAWRSNSTKVHFYGRRGQAQYGLDIVEHLGGAKPTLYQVRRLQSLQANDVTGAVHDYARDPRPDQPRRFDPDKFVLITSAEFDSDTGNVDALDAMNVEYAGDLEVEVWGAETLSRELRNYPRLVYAMFGPHWADAWCGWRPTDRELAVPNALAFTNDPASVLGVSATLLAASTDEPTRPREAANAYHQVAETFEAKRFPAHATTIRLSEARALRAAGDSDDAFDLEFAVALQHVRSGMLFFEPSSETLVQRAVTEPQQAKAQLIGTLTEWAEHGVNLEQAIPALSTLHAEADDAFTELCLMTAEYALVDGLFDFDPPRSLSAAVRSEDLSGDLDTLRHLLGATTSPSDAVLRARLDCAVADASLRLSSGPAAVDAAYSAIAAVAMQSGYLHATGLAKSRLAYAHAQRGGQEAALTWWRSSIKDACEAAFNGDARQALLSVRDLDNARGQFPTPIFDLMAALVGDARVLAQRFDPQLGALDAAHRHRLPDAFGDARRFLWEARLAGHHDRVRDATTLLADVLEAGGQPSAAVIAHIAAGEPGEAERIARSQEPIDLSAWLGTGDDRRRSAVVRVIGAQADRYPDGLVPFVAALLLEYAKDLWSEISLMAPCPTWDAIKALRDLGLRIPALAIDGIIELARPTIENANLIGAETIAELLVNAYCAVPERRADLAEVLGARMARQEATPELWDVVEQIPEGARGEIEPHVVSAATAGLRDAIACAAIWRLDTLPNQIGARRVAAHLLRRPLNTNVGRQVLSHNEAATVNLLLGLLSIDEADVIEFDPREFTPERSGPAAGVIAAMGAAEDSEGAEPNSPASGSASEAAIDEAAQLAAGPPAQLAAAVTRKLVAISENTLEGAGTRAHAIDAASRLAEHLDPTTVSAAVRAAKGVFDDPLYSPIDQQNRSWDHDLSRVRIDMGQRHLRARALKAATHVYRVARLSATNPLPTDADLALELISGACEMLATDDQANRHAGAEALFDLVESGDVASDVLTVLLGDRDGAIRAAAVRVLQPAAGWIETLARDQDARVRRAVAGLPHLTDAVRMALTADPDPAVSRRARHEDTDAASRSSSGD